MRGCPTEDGQTPPTAGGAARSVTVPGEVAGGRWGSWTGSQWGSWLVITLWSVADKDEFIGEIVIHELVTRTQTRSVAYGPETQRPWWHLVVHGLVTQDLGMIL